MDRRILFSDNATIIDYSLELFDYKSGSASVTVVSAEDKLFIGSRNPFNGFYFKLGASVNNNVSSMVIKYWDGREFVSAIDILDQTSISGATLAQSGYVTFSTNTTDGWYRESTNNEGDEVTGLTSVNILNLYWLEISFSADLDAVTLDWIGNKFCTDNDLYGEFPIFNRTGLKTSFEAGKTTWEEQCVRASDIVVADLIKSGTIDHEGQLIERDKLKLATIQKTAEIIFGGMGDDYRDDVIAARNEYKQRLNGSILLIDKNKNARVDVVEEKQRQGWLSR